MTKYFGAAMLLIFGALAPYDSASSAESAVPEPFQGFDPVSFFYALGPQTIVIIDDCLYGWRDTSFCIRDVSAVLLYLTDTIQDVRSDFLRIAHGQPVFQYFKVGPF